MPVLSGRNNRERVRPKTKRQSGVMKEYSLTLGCEGP